MKPLEGLTYPKGFRVATGFAKIKSQGPDMLLLVANQPVTTCAMFTTNQMKASSVILGAETLAVSKNQAQAILVNSGNANAATGTEGVQDTRDLIHTVANALQIDSSYVLMSSTGIIGERLPVPAMQSEIQAMVSQLSDQDSDSSQAILTTDTCTKTYSCSFVLGEDEVRISGIAKGSGMIHPNMATMLSYITTDIHIDATLLESIFRDCVQKSFHCITVDGDQSTNDTVILMASGLSSSSLVTDTSSVEATTFCEHLFVLMQELAKDIVRDGEGASKFITVKVTGAASDEDAYKVAMAIAQSSLVKTAMFGCDPNWGRIVAAAGSAGVVFDPAQVTLSLQDQVLLQNNTLVTTKEALKSEMKESNLLIHIDLALGQSQSECWTSDLSYDYVKINAEYYT